MKKVAFVFYFLVFCLYSIFTYSLTDPNLVLTSWEPYWFFQKWMWQTFFNNPHLLTLTYTFLITLLFFSYYLSGLVPMGITKNTKPLPYLFLYFLFTLSLIFSYNALSHDVFNYIFNAKMVMMYQTNPHQNVALQFGNDLWLRFMHNTHTPAPYGYGWTAISLLPSIIGFGKFTFTWFVFRLFNLLSIGFLVYAFFQLAKSKQHQNKLVWPAFFAVLINPLFLIEVVSNNHNDVWMMAPALLSLGLLNQMKKLQFKKICFSLLLLFFSISIKLSTLVLIPIWLSIFFELEFFQNKLPEIIKKTTSFIHSYYADMSALLLFLPLLTTRSQQFNSWYLIWLIVWLPFMKLNILKGAILVLSVSSMYRYIPWLLAGRFSDEIFLQQKLITWIPLLFYFIFALLYSLLKTVMARYSDHSRVE